MPVPSHVETAEQIESALAEIVAKLVAAFSPECIYLFGSRARGDARPDSDYDILIVVRHADSSSYRRATAAYRAVGDTSVPVDWKVLTSNEFQRDAEVVASLPAAVRRHGQLLYAA